MREMGEYRNWEACPRTQAVYICVAVITYRLIAIIEIDLKVWRLYLSRANPWQSCAYHRLCCTAKQRAYAAVNTELIELYWHIGAYISQQVEKAAWGKSVVEQLADYICAQEPNSEGFSKQNLWRMKLFYETY